LYWLLGGAEEASLLKIMCIGMKDPVGFGLQDFFFVGFLNSPDSDFLKVGIVLAPFTKSETGKVGNDG
jgi:hypothetical protein